MPTPDEKVPETAIPGKESPQEWIMYFDGAFSLQGAGAGVLLVAPTGEHLKYIVQLHFPREEATNNTAEYEGLFVGLQTEHVPRAENGIADHLSKCAAQKLSVEPGTFVLHLTQPFVS